MEMCVIFYPSGHLQLQVPDDDFCHVYDSPERLAKDVSDLMDGDTALGWYGNDLDAWVDEGKLATLRHITASQIPGYLADLKAGKVDVSDFWPHQEAFYQAMMEKRNI